MQINQSIIDAIAADEFARKTLEATRAFIYAHFRDWDRIYKSGRIAFTDDDATTAYHALSVLLGTDEKPDLGDAKVTIGGCQMSTFAIEILGDALAGKLV